jgi:hypothetical protein
LTHNEFVFAPWINRLPNAALATHSEELVALLFGQYGEAVQQAFDPEKSIQSPLEGTSSTDWMKTANCVGINVRTIGSFWKIVPYSLTLPPSQRAIHILPIWEPGVVASLYGMSSWEINPEFFSPELARLFPHLDTVEKQLKVVTNLLHLMGRTVGMDVVPHTDRYAEQVLANPRCFEWLQRRDDHITRHEGDLWRAAEQLIFEALLQMGSAMPDWGAPPNAADFYNNWSEEARTQYLFGHATDHHGRLARRKIIIQWLYDHGFETVPATMGPPYRGLEVDPNPSASVYDEEGRLWRDYRITRPKPMSRVFGPLARYRLYESKDNNANWELDFGRPVEANWQYVCAHYQSVAMTYGFDFMRGDMSHVQMRPDGVPDQPDAYYDILGAVKQAIRAERPWFAYFAESFMALPGEMAFGDEYEHLEASLADSTLGDLQSEPIGTGFWVREFARYIEVLETRGFAPNFTILTADKDDPRFDQFYLRGNEARHFIALFLPIMPSYMALGFECRDPHPRPAPNEHYTKLYVFQLKEGPKGTQGPYHWGTNHSLHANLVRQRQLASQLGDVSALGAFEWVFRPDPKGDRRHIGWRLGQHLFVVNLNTEQTAPNIPLNHLGSDFEIIFSTLAEQNLVSKIKDGSLSLKEGEGVLLRII